MELRAYSTVHAQVPGVSTHHGLRRVEGVDPDEVLLHLK